MGWLNINGNWIGRNRGGQSWQTYWKSRIPEFKTYAESLTTPLTDDQANAIGNFYNDIIAGTGVSSLSELFDAAWLIRGETEESSFHNLVKNAHHLTKHGLVTWTQWVGIAGGGGYVDTHYNPHDEGINFSLNSGALGLYTPTNKSEATIDMGARKAYGDDMTYIQTRDASATNKYNGRINQDAHAGSCDITTSIGMSIINRTEALKMVGYRDKNEMFEETASTATVMPDFNIYLLAVNNGGTAAAASTKIIEFAFISKGLTKSQADVITDAYSAYRERLFFLMDYDVVIVGAGAGGIGAAYALKDSGLSIAMIDQNTVLGGTHNAGMVTDFCASPDPGFFKTNVYDYLRSLNKCSEIADYYKSQMCYVQPSVDGAYGVSHAPGLIYFDRVALAAKYASDLFGKVNIKLQTKFLSASSTGGQCTSIVVKDITANQTHTLTARYFIDASGGMLAKSINTTKGTDYFVGADAKTKYNESCYPDEYAGNEDTINGLDFHYRIAPDAEHTEDTSSYPDVEGTGVSTNGIRTDWTNNQYRFVFTDEGGNFDRSLFKSTTPEALRADWLDNVLSSWKIEKATTAGMTEFKFDAHAEMIGIREGWRIACDNMIKQDDTTVRITSATDLAATKHIAVASWYFDFHGGAGATVSELEKLRVLPFGIPIGSLFPVGLKNVSIACRALGVSHLASAVVRITKTMMAVGYAAGFIAEDFVNNDRADQRDVPVATIQTKVGIADTIEYLEDNCYGKSYDTTWTP